MHPTPPQPWAVNNGHFASTDSFGRYQMISDGALVLGVDIFCNSFLSAINFAITARG